MNEVAAAIWAISSSLAFQGANTLVKIVGSSLPNPEIALFRAAGGVLLLALMWRELVTLRRLADPLTHAVRGSLGALTMLCLMHALVTLPMALVTTVYYGRVLLMIPLAWLVLRERPSLTLCCAALVGFVGIGIAAEPSFQSDHRTSTIILLVATVASAGSQIAVTRLTRSNPPSLIVAVFAFVSMLVVAPPAATMWQTPTMTEVAQLIGIGLAGAGAQYAVTRAYALAGASFVAPFSYLEIPIAAVIGFALNDKLPTGQEIVGGLLVVGAALFITLSARPRPVQKVAVA